MVMRTVKAGDELRVVPSLHQAPCLQRTSISKWEYHTNLKNCSRQKILLVSVEKLDFMKSHDENLCICQQVWMLTAGVCEHACMSVYLRTIKVICTDSDSHGEGQGRVCGNGRE